MSDARTPDGRRVADGGTVESDDPESDDEEDATAAGGRPCPRCDRPMYHRHCKYVCPAHGVVYDCADTFY